MLAGPAWVFAAGAGVQLDKANIDPTNKESLQRGARLFVNYCLSCHAAGLMRYDRIGNARGIDEKLVSENLMFTGGKIGDLMTVATAPKDAKAYFGTVPPDLSVIARSRGVDWLYTYMRSFYRDDSKIIGVNNRDLATFATDLAVAEAIAPSIPDGVVTVGESGVSSVGGASRMAAAGYDAILVGAEPVGEARVENLPAGGGAAVSVHQAAGFLDVMVLIVGDGSQFGRRGSLLFITTGTAASFGFVGAH